MNDIPYTYESSPAEQRRYAQQGFVLIWVTVLLVGIGAAIAAGMASMKSSSDQRQALQARQALEWAEQALAGYAAAHGRLPCPARTADGTEDCSAGHMKGWLPAKTLQDGSLKTNRHLTPPDRNYPALRYVVYRNAASVLDLTRAESNYTPRTDSYNPSNFNGDRTPVVNGNITSFCEKLQRANPRVVSTFSHGPVYSTDAGHKISTHTDIWRTGSYWDAPEDASQAGILSSGSTVRNVAFGLTISGDGAESGINSKSAIPHLEKTLRVRTAQSSDMVNIMHFNQLSELLGCAPRLASLDTMAMFASVADGIQESKEANYKNSIASATLASIKAAQSTLKFIIPIINLTRAVITIVTVVVHLITAIVSCVASFGTTCYKVGLLIAAMTFAVIGLAQSIRQAHLAQLSVAADIRMAVTSGIAATKTGRSITMTVTNDAAATTMACEASETIDQEIEKLIKEKERAEYEQSIADAHWNQLDLYFQSSDFYESKILPIAELHAKRKFAVERLREDRNAKWESLERAQESNGGFDYEEIENALITAKADNVESVLAQLKDADSKNENENILASHQEAYDKAQLALVKGEADFQKTKAAWDDMLRDVAVQVRGNSQGRYQLAYCPDLGWRHDQINHLRVHEMLIGTCQLRLRDYEHWSYMKEVHTTTANELRDKANVMQEAKASMQETCEFMENISIGTPGATTYSVWQGGGDIVRRALLLDSEPALQKHWN